MTKARGIADSTETLDVDGGTIKLDGNYPTGTGNVALGDAALDDGSLSGNYNTAVGSGALTANTTGSNNFAFGANTLYSNTTGSNNAAISGLYSNTTGGNNTALGMQSLNSNTTASNNTAVGYQAGYSNTTGLENTAVGYKALEDNTTASFNVALGREALADTTTSGYNTALGHLSGRFTTGTRNTYVGQEAGYYVTTGSRNTILGRYNGNQGGLDIRTASNNIVLSDGDGNPRLKINSAGDVHIPGSVDNPGTSGAVGVRVLPIGFLDISRSSGQGININRETSDGGVVHFLRSNVQVGTISVTTSSTAYATSSDHRLKENVVELTGATERLKQLNPSRFNFIADADTTVDGFIAHEVQSVVPEAVTGTKDAVNAEGNPEYQGIDQSKLVPLLVATIKELEARITALENA